MISICVFERGGGSEIPLLVGRVMFWPRVNDILSCYVIIMEYLRASFCYFSTLQAPPTPNSTPPLPHWEEAELEEQQLRQKLKRLADNISEQSESSEEEEEEVKPSGLSLRPASRSSIIFSRLEEHQTDSEKVDSPQDPPAVDFTASFNVSKAVRSRYVLHIWSVGPHSVNSITAGSQFQHKCLP